MEHPEQALVESTRKNVCRSTGKPPPLWRGNQFLDAQYSFNLIEIVHERDRSVYRVTENKFGQIGSKFLCSIAIVFVVYAVGTILFHRARGLPQDDSLHLAKIIAPILVVWFCLLCFRLNMGNGSAILECFNASGKLCYYYSRSRTPFRTILPHEIDDFVIELRDVESTPDRNGRRTGYLMQCETLLVLLTNGNKIPVCASQNRDALDEVHADLSQIIFKAKQRGNRAGIEQGG